MLGPEYFQRVGWVFDGYVCCVDCVEQDGEPLECYRCGRQTVEGAEDVVRMGCLDTTAGECRAPDDESVGGACRGLLYPVDGSDTRGEPMYASEYGDFSEGGLSCDNCTWLIFEGDDDES